MFVIKNIDTRECLGAYLSREVAESVARRLQKEGMNVGLEFLTDWL